MNTNTEEPIRYQISTLRDIFLLPTKEKMLTCLTEMRALLEQSRSVSDLTATLAGLPEGEPAIIFPDFITWIDDGKGEIAPTYCAEGNPIFTLHEVVASEEFNPTDTERLDWLESGSNGMPWIARESTTGRGFRLHNDQSGSFGESFPTAREAIDAAMLEEEDAGDLPDQYGNTEREPFKFCSFPDCGCDGARLCQAKSGPSSAACAINIERGSL